MCEVSHPSAVFSFSVCLLRSDSRLSCVQTCLQSGYQISAYCLSKFLLGKAQGTLVNSSRRSIRVMLKSGKFAFKSMNHRTNKCYHSIFALVTTDVTVVGWPGHDIYHATVRSSPEA